MNTLRHLREGITYGLFLLSCLMPRDQRLWACIGWHIGAGTEVFADNTKYLFLHIANNRKDLRAVWLAKDPELARILRARGYSSYYQHSLMGVWCALRAGTTVIDAYLQPENYRWSGRTRLVQLLHGKGMKKGGYAQKPLHAQDRIFSTSPFVSSMLPQVFVEKSPIVVAGYSRGDLFFKEIPGSDIGVHEPTRMMLEDTRYAKRFLYAPTFRRGAKTLNIETFLDIPHLSTWLLERRYLMVISLHPKYRDQVRNLSYPNIHFLEDSDVYPLLPLVDILINDYSSIFTDYLLLDRPIIFYPYDLAAYTENEGLSFESYDEYTPGPKAYTYPELIRTLEETVARDSHAGERARVRDLYHTYQNGESSERIMRALER
ncbi:MAG: CDP-glycerol glycerophosphotransferase family protein [Patescibacteria group bacterium]